MADDPPSSGLRLPPLHEDFAGDFIDRYRLDAPIGEGAFGVVWRATQLEPVHREIALKLIKRGRDSSEVVARFGAESQALAMMDHPNIAAILDAGTAADGRPWFAMELVKGEPLNTYCESRSLTVRGRLELFIQVCQAVQHAHQKAILHRDLKPSNILVAEVDGRAVPKVIDFGIAKVLGNPHDAGMRTRLGEVVGTLSYMSPEQAGSAPDVDTRSDIYSLGVILYELLSGNTPLGTESTAYDETLRRIRTEEPAWPSSRCGSLGDRRLLRGDLDWIVMKSLEKDRRHRYETAATLAADLRHHLDRKPVSVAAPSWSYQFSKFAQRHRVALTAAGAVSLALVAGTGVSLWQAANARAAQLAAEQSHAAAETNFTRAREAVDRYLSRVTDHPQLKEADFLSLRRGLLESALPFYEKLAANTGSDPLLRAGQSEALGNLASIYRDVGEPTKSADVYQKAIDLDEELLAANPQNPALREALAIHCNNLGSVLLPEQSIDILRRGVEIAGGLAKEFPADPRYQQGWAAGLLNLGEALHVKGQMDEGGAALRQALAIGEGLMESAPDDRMSHSYLAAAMANVASHIFNQSPGEAEGLYRRSLTTFEKLMADFPADYGYRGMNGATCQNFGLSLAGIGRSDDALAQFQRSVEIHRRLVADFPSMPSPRYSLANALHATGYMQQAASRDGEAEESFKEALALFRSLHADHPSVGDYAFWAGMMLDRLAVIRQRSGDWAGTRAHCEGSILCFRDALRLNPADATYQSGLRGGLTKLAQARVATGDGDAALACLTECCSNLAAHWSDYETIAATIAGTLPLLGKDRQDEASQWTGKAVSLLQCAIDLGYPEMDTFKDSPKFAALRGDPAFMALQPPPLDPADHSPSRFSFDYAFDDPGKRSWSRDGNTWQEVQPSGKRNAYEIVRRLRVHGVPGTEILGSAEPVLRLFIPDRGTTAPLHLKMMTGPGQWQLLGEISGVE